MSEQVTRAGQTFIIGDPSGGVQTSIDFDARALELAKAEHARMGAAMREHMPGHEQTIVTAWETMSRERRNVMVAVWRSLLDDGVVT